MLSSAAARNARAINGGAKSRSHRQGRGRSRPAGTASSSATPASAPPAPCTASSARRVAPATHAPDHPARARRRHRARGARVRPPNGNATDTTFDTCTFVYVPHCTVYLDYIPVSVYIYLLSSTVFSSSFLDQRAGVSSTALWMVYPDTPANMYTVDSYTARTRDRRAGRARRWRARRRRPRRRSGDGSADHRGASTRRPAAAVARGGGGVLGIIMAWSASLCNFRPNLLSSTW